ncbi:hypothetical protein [Escherichia coli]
MRGSLSTLLACCCLSRPEEVNSEY